MPSRTRGFPEQLPCAAVFVCGWAISVSSAASFAGFEARLTSGLGDSKNVVTMDSTKSGRSRIAKWLAPGSTASWASGRAR